MYPIAVKDGIPADQFWSMTFEEIIVQTDANQKAKEEDLKNQANMDYRMSQAISIAFNNPEKMPSFETLYPFASEEAQLTEEERFALEMEREKQNMLILAEQIKATRARKNAKKPQG